MVFVLERWSFFMTLMTWLRWSFLKFSYLGWFTGGSFLISTTNGKFCWVWQLPRPQLPLITYVWSCFCTLNSLPNLDLLEKTIKYHTCSCISHSQLSTHLILEELVLRKGMIEKKKNNQEQISTNRMVPSALSPSAVWYWPRKCQIWQCRCHNPSETRRKGAWKLGTLW